MIRASLDIRREQILGYRRLVGALDGRLPPGADSLRKAAWAGLQDSMPRAALLSIHARVAGTPPDVLDDPALIQVWGPRFSAYAVAAVDLPLFTLGRLPDNDRGRRRAEEMADLLDGFLGGRQMKDRDIHAALNVGNSIRYATTTGRVAIRWEGARAPTIWMVPRPDMSPTDARLELARRYLHIFGPATADSFANWAGITPRAAADTFTALAASLVAVVTPIGDCFILSSDEQTVRGAHTESSAVRLLPSGDAYFLLHGRDRELLVPDDKRRPELWTSRVWPGALVIGGEVVGTWRRSDEKVDIEPWRKLTASDQHAVEQEVASLPLPGLKKPIAVRWLSRS